MNHVYRDTDSHQNDRLGRQGYFQSTSRDNVVMGMRKYGIHLSMILLRLDLVSRLIEILIQYFAEMMAIVILGVVRKDVGAVTHFRIPRE